MLDWNPSHHSRHAWNDAKTVYGKIGLVIFYSLIWLSILAALWQLIWPESEGAKCALDAVASNHVKARTLLIALLRAENVLWIGFMGYADVGGLKVKNVGMVTFFLIFWALCVMPVGDLDSCMSAKWLWIFPGWAFLALIFAFAEYKLGDHGSTSETQNLVV
jgi:hypothetical protein